MVSRALTRGRNLVAVVNEVVRDDFSTPRLYAKYRPDAEAFGKECLDEATLQGVE